MANPQWHNNVINALRNAFEDVTIVNISLAETHILVDTIDVCLYENNVVIGSSVFHFDMDEIKIGRAIIVFLNSIFNIIDAIKIKYISFENGYGLDGNIIYSLDSIYFIDYVNGFIRDENNNNIGDDEDKNLLVTQKNSRESLYLFLECEVDSFND